MTEPNSSTPRRPVSSLIVRLALAAASAGALLLTSSLMLGGSYKWTVLGIRVQASDFVRPLSIGAALAMVLLVYGWKQRAFRLLAVGLLAAFGMLALAAYAREARAYIPAGDIALLESYTIHASRGRLLVGAYSRFGWHHPGPIYFYVLAPFYALADHRTVGLWSGALWINLVSIAALAWILLAYQRGRLAALSLGFAALYLFRVREILASPWNPHVIIAPTLLLVVLSAVLASGELAAMPFVALLATAIVQTHVGLLPAVLAVAGCSTAAALFLARRTPDAPIGARVYRSVNVTLWTLAVSWFLPLVDQFSSRHGNLADLWRFFTSPERRGQPFGAAFTAWGETLGAMLSRQIHVGWGHTFRSQGDWIAVAAAVVQVGVLAFLAFRAGRQGRRFSCALAALTALVSGVGLWSATRVEDQLVDYAVFWLSGVGALNLAVIADEVLVSMWRWPVRRGRRPALAACGLLYLFVAALGFDELRAAISRSANPGPHEVTAMRLSAQIESYLRDHPGTKPLIKLDGSVWVDVAALVVSFQRKEIPFAVERNWLWMFTELSAPSGDENALMTTVAREGLRDQLVAAGGISIGESRGVYVVLAPHPSSRQ